MHFSQASSLSTVQTHRGFPGKWVTSLNSRQRLRKQLSERELHLVPGGGVEPPRPEGRRILSPLRLPVPPSRLYLQVPEIKA
jgi:hypothetical protein